MVTHTNLLLLVLDLYLISSICTISSNSQPLLHFRSLNFQILICAVNILSIHLSVNERRGVACAEEDRCMLGNAVSEERTVTDVADSSRCSVGETQRDVSCVVVDVNVVFLWSRCILGNVVL